MNNHAQWGKDFIVSQKNGTSDLWVRGEFHNPKMVLIPHFHWENSKEYAPFMAQNQEQAIDECAECIESLLRDALQGSRHRWE
jgi:hypothetical protein